MFGSSKGPKGEAKQFCNAVGSNVHQQISKALKESGTVFDNSDQIIFFKSYFDSFYLGVILMLEGPSDWIADDDLKKWICDGVLPNRLWEFYNRADGLIELSSGMAQEAKVNATVKQGESAGRNDAYYHTSNLYRFLVGKTLDIKDDHQEDEAVIKSGVPSDHPNEGKESNDAPVTDTTQVGNTAETEPKNVTSRISSTPKETKQTAPDRPSTQPIQKEQQSDGSLKFLLYFAIGIVIVFGGINFFTDGKWQTKQPNSYDVKSPAPTVGNNGGRIKQGGDNDRSKLEYRFNSEVTRTIQNSINRLSHSNQNTQNVDLELTFSRSGALLTWATLNRQQIDDQFLSRVMNRATFPVPPTHMSSTRVRVLMPKKQIRQNPKPTVASKPAPAKPTIDLQLRDNPSVAVSDLGRLSISIDTNWTPNYETPIVAIAPEESFLINDIAYDVSLVSKLTVGFVDTQRRIYIYSTPGIPPGRHTVLLEIINGDKLINVPVWFDVPRD